MVFLWLFGLMIRGIIVDLVLLRRATKICLDNILEENQYIVCFYCGYSHG